MLLLDLPPFRRHLDPAGGAQVRKPGRVPLGPAPAPHLPRQDFHQSLPKPCGRSAPVASCTVSIAPCMSRSQTASSFSPTGDCCKFSGRLSRHSSYSCCTSSSVFSAASAASAASTHRWLRLLAFAIVSPCWAISSGRASPETRDDLLGGGLPSFPSPHRV